MSETNKNNEISKIEEIEKLFQETMFRLQQLHDEKLELIKKIRAENNLTELAKLRESLKERA